MRLFFIRKMRSFAADYLRNKKKLTSMKRNLFLSIVLLLCALPSHAQLEELFFDMDFSKLQYYVRAGYESPWNSTAKEALDQLLTSSSSQTSGVSFVGGFRVPLSSGFYGGMEAGLIAGFRHTVSKETSTGIFGTEEKEGTFDDTVLRPWVQWTPLLTGYRYELLPFLKVDLHVGLNMRFCPFSYRNTILTIEGDSKWSAGTEKWANYEHFVWRPQYGFSFRLFDIADFGLTAYGVDGLFFNVQYEF